MNKPSLFLALVAFAALSSCSDDKELSRNDHCQKTPPNKECFIGNWAFEGVWENSNAPSHDCVGTGFLKLKKEGGFEFNGEVGGVYNKDYIGTWDIDGDIITIKDIELGEDRSGKVDVKSSGNNIEIKPNGNSTVFAVADGCGGQQIEKFRWQGP